MRIRLAIAFLWCMACVTTMRAQTDSLELQPLPMDSLGLAQPVALLTPEDSAGVTALTKKTRVKRDWAKWKPNPKRAMWLAIVLPGAGQIYNRKYWKLPIVYGGFLGCAYAMRWNNQMYMDYSQAYLDIMDDDPNTKSYTQFLHLGTEITPANEERYKQIFKSRKDKYRRWRDLSFFVMLGIYALSIVDAYVDASLSQFDISDDLSLRLEPAVISGSAKTMTGGGNNPLSNSGIGVHGSLIF